LNGSTHIPIHIHTHDAQEREEEERIQQYNKAVGSHTDEAEKARQARWAEQQATVARIVEEARKRQEEEDKLRQVCGVHPCVGCADAPMLIGLSLHQPPNQHKHKQLQEVLVQEEMQAARLAEEAARREKRARERQEMAAAYQEQVGWVTR
jgi:hypothetical protein